MNPSLKVGKLYKPFIVAEMSGNHNHSLERALQIVDAAAISGADAIKLQTYTADTMTIDSNNRDFIIQDKDSLWSGNTLYSLYKKAYTPWKWHKKIFERCRKRGIIGFSTPFDESAVDFLETLQVPFYKVASFENNYLQLIKKIAKTKKPIIISTGMATLSQIAEAVNVARRNGCQQVVLLKCTSTYPASPKDSNIKTIPFLRKRFHCEVGLSDHTMGIGVALASIAMGATIIEKHLTLNRSDGGADAIFSIEPIELKQLAEGSISAWQSLGNVTYKPTESENRSKIFRRSIYIIKDVKKGDKLSVDTVRIIRPGYGMEPRFYEQILGKTASKNIFKGTPLKPNLINK